MKNLKTPRSVFIKNYLLENYNTKSKDDIINDLGLSWNYIQKMAHLFNIKREFCDSKRSLIKLLNLDDNISCYWLGFLLSDGHITKKYVFNVNLNIKDKVYFENIQNHLNIELAPHYVKKNNCVRYIMADKQTIKEISEKFKWKTNKTKNPPLIPKLGEEQIFSLIIGFIDGDGYISKKGTITIKCDVSWKNILEYFYFKLTGKEKKFNMTSDGLSIIYILKLKEVINIKEKSIKLNLPIMGRKWDRVKNRILKEDKRLIVIDMLNKKYNINQIIEKTNFSKSLIYSVKKEKDIKRDIERNI